MSKLLPTTRKVFVIIAVMAMANLLGCANRPGANESQGVLSGDTIPTGEPRLIPVAPGYSETSVNAVIFRRNALVTWGNYQFIGFYNPDGAMVLGRRTLGEDHWHLHTTPHSADVRNAHNSISLAIDGQGYLHVSWGQHSVPLRYARSLEPAGLELGEPGFLGTDTEHHRVTYPEFYLLPDGDLLFMYRHGSSGDGSQVLHRYHHRAQTWELVHESLIDGQGEVNPYWQVTIDASGTLHLSWNWRRHGGVETNHDLAYARSRDGGVTWERTDGTPYDLPITPESAEYALRIPENSTMMNQTSMAADSKGRPYIVNYWRPQGSDVPQYHLVYHDGEHWQVSPVGRLSEPFDLVGGGTMAPPISRPQIAVDVTGETDRAFVLFRARERDRRVSVAVTDDLQQGDWRFVDLTDFSVGAWEPGYDPVLWQENHELHIFVQHVEQADHERPVPIEPQMVYVLEWRP